MTALISAAEARVQLRLGPAGDVNDDADLASQILQAEAIFLQYLNDGAIPDDWIDDTVSPEVVTVPYIAKAAVILILQSLWDNRGDDPLAKALPLMYLLRGPSLA